MRTPEKNTNKKGLYVRMDGALTSERSIINYFDLAKYAQEQKSKVRNLEQIERHLRIMMNDKMHIIHLLKMKIRRLEDGLNRD